MAEVKKMKLVGITHAIVRNLSAEDAKASGIYAYVELCLGPGDDDALVGLAYMKIDKSKFGFRGPETILVRDGHTVVVPAIKGELSMELIGKAAKAVSLVKEKIGKWEPGKHYRVTSKNVVELETAKPAAQAPVVPEEPKTNTTVQ
jgi:hypothetical protein